MRGAGSVRARVLLGTCLWTLGLFVIFGIVLTQALFRHPAAPGIFHRFFLYVGPLSVLAAGCLAAGLALVRWGLGSFGDLRRRLAALRAGRERRLDGPFPAEVQPLIRELNDLLDARDARVAHALAAAGDLAHGLKTPLAVLNHVADRARAESRGDLADAVTQQVERMRRQVEYHLAQARASVAGTRGDARAVLRSSADGLVRTMQAVHADRRIDLAVDIDAAMAVAVDRHDLDEMLGNLLDNACKWAQARVTVGAERHASATRVTVDDDGPGLAPELRQAVLRRGVRADEAAPGSGLGLAIVDDLARRYGGDLVLSGSPLGGLRVALTLPAAPLA